MTGKVGQTGKGSSGASRAFLKYASEALSVDQNYNEQYFRNSGKVSE